MGSRIVRAMSVLVLAVSAVATASTDASAAASLDLYVDTTGSGRTCSQTQPCPTIQTAVDLADSTPAVVHLAKARSFDAPVTIAADQQITVVGAGTESANGSISEGPTNAPVFTNHGALTLQDVAITPGSGTAVDQDAGSLAILGANVRSGFTAALVIRGGYAAVRNALIAYGSGTVAQALKLTSGTVELHDVTAFAPISQTGGVLRMDGLRSDTPIDVSAGITEITQSHLSNQVEVSHDARVFLQNDTFESGSVVVADANATAVVVNSTAWADDSVFTSTAGGQLRLAATAIDGPSNAMPACVGPVVDGNYNSSFDGSCKFDSTTSRNSHPNGLQASSAFRRYADDLAPRPDGPLVDALPTDAVAAFDPNFNLCNGLDIRGQSRPVGSACDIGAYELAPITVRTSVADASLVWRQDAVVSAAVAQPSGNAEQPTTGTLVFDFDGAERCRTHVAAAATYTCRTAPPPGTRSVTARFTPSGGLRSGAGTAALRVGKAPLRMGIEATETVRSGKPATVRLHVTNDATSAPIRNHRAKLYFYTSDTGWYLAKTVTTDSDGRASYRFTPGRNVAYRWRIDADTYYLAGASPTAHTTVR